jgi:hypothetical protein
VGRLPWWESSLSAEVPRHSLLKSKWILCSSKSSGFTFGLEQSEDVALSDWALHVTDEGSLLVGNEFDLHLGDTATGACKMNQRDYLPVLPMISSTTAYWISAESIFELYLD